MGNWGNTKVCFTNTILPLWNYYFDVFACKSTAENMSHISILFFEMVGREWETHFIPVVKIRDRNSTILTRFGRNIYIHLTKLYSCHWAVIFDFENNIWFFSDKTDIESPDSSIITSSAANNIFYHDLRAENSFQTFNRQKKVKLLQP